MTSSRTLPLHENPAREVLISDKRPSVLSITDVESTGVTGLHLDFRVIHAMGLQSLSVVTALTWPGPSDVRICKIPRRVVEGAIDGAFRTHRVSACTLGVLPTPELVKAVGDRLRRRSVPSLVIHPVIFASSGVRVLRQEGVLRLRALLPLASCVIASAEDAAALCASSRTPAECAQELVRRGAPVAVIRGGEAQPDLLCSAGGMQEMPASLESRRQGSTAFLAAAVACRLALDQDPLSAYAQAAEWLRFSSAGGLLNPSSGRLSQPERQ